MTRALKTNHRRPVYPVCQSLDCAIFIDERPVHQQTEHLFVRDGRNPQPPENQSNERK